MMSTHRREIPPVPPFAKGGTYCARRLAAPPFAKGGQGGICLEFRP